MRVRVRWGRFMYELALLTIALHCVDIRERS
jgi:hypothetical protein